MVEPQGLVGEHGEQPLEADLGGHDAAADHVAHHDPLVGVDDLRAQLAGLGVLLGHARRLDALHARQLADGLRQEQLVGQP